jgi:hypothetical protein
MGVFHRWVRRHGRALTFVLATVLGVLLVSGAALGAQGAHGEGAAPSKISTSGLGSKPAGMLQHAPTNLDRLRSVTHARTARPATYASTAVTLSPAAAATPAAADLAAAPPTPTITSAPPNPAYSLSATFQFSAAGATSYQCLIDTNPLWRNCNSPKNYGSLPYGERTFSVRARNATGTSAAQSYSWTIDRPPAPTISSKPATTTVERTAVFAFTTTFTGATFECRLDLGSYANCTSPRTYTNLPLGSHTFRVRAKTRYGPGAETVYSWTITSLPAPTITSAPTSPTAETNASFVFSSPVSGATFECRLDDSATWVACTSPQTYGPLAVGTHTFRVRAVHPTYGTSVETASSWTIIVAPAKPVKMRLLVVSADGNETDYPALKAFLSQLGVPYTEMIATQTDLTPAILRDGDVGKYQGVILTTGNLTYNAAPAGEAENWISAFSPEEWQTLWDYEAEYKVRQVTSFTFPYGLPDDYGLNLQTYQDTLATPLQASLTDAGKGVFSYLNTSSPVTFKGAWVYLATKRDASVTPLITTSDGYVIASTNTYPDGRQNLAVTAANNPFLLHSQLLSYGLVNWVTKGVFLGERHVSVGVQVDDLFIDSDMWDVDDNSDLTGLRYRLDGGDWQDVLNWQNSVRARPNLSNFRLEFAFNGEGADPNTWVDDPLTPNGDTLTPAVKATQLNFNFVNHTYTHAGLDLTDYDTSKDEITRNQQMAATLGLTNYDADSFVQPDISGLTNPNFLQAAFDTGIRYLISDASRPEWANPSPNAGFWSQLQPDIFIVPRRANNLFYSLRTPDEWVDEYNWFYWLGSPSNSPWKFWANPQTFDEILDHESDNLLSYMLRWDDDPWMFHQANLGRYNGSNSLLGKLLDATFDKYAQVYNLPVRNVTQKQAGELMKRRMAYDASGVDATLVPCQSITLSVASAAVVPVTGAAAGTTESYGGQSISSVPVSPGSTETIPVSC